MNSKPYRCKLLTTSLAALSPDGFYTKPYCCKLFTASPAAQSPVRFYTKPYCCKLFTTSAAVQRVQHNLLPNTEPANCSQPSQLPKVQQNSPPKLTSASCSQPPHFPESSRIVNHTLPRQAVHNRLKQNLILQAAFNLNRSLKLRQQYIHPRYCPGSKSSAEFPEPTVFGILVKLIEESSVPAVV